MKTIIYNRETNQWFWPRELEVIIVSEELYDVTYYENLSTAEERGGSTLHEDEGTRTPKYKYLNLTEKIINEIKRGFTHIWGRFYMPQLVEAVVPRITPSAKTITQGPSDNEKVIFHSTQDQAVYKHYKENFGGKDFEIDR